MIPYSHKPDTVSSAAVKGDCWEKHVVYRVQMLYPLVVFWWQLWRCALRRKSGTCWMNRLCCWQRGEDNWNRYSHSFVA